MQTLLACLTPPGKAAIAVLAVRGPGAWDITRQLFRPANGTLPDRPTQRRVWFGRIGADAGDDAILTVKGDNEVEIHCHGGIEVVRMIQEHFIERGVTIVSWQQFLHPLQEFLANAPTVRTAAILLDQVNGAWERGETPIARLRELIPLGQHLVTPWKIAIAGAPNVGKSSLVNALAGYTRSVVSATPGTTRDVVGVRLAIDGWPVEIIDTAGIRAADADLEGQGIERAKAAARAADLRLWILDGAAAPIMPDVAADWLPVINKIDLPAAWDWKQMSSALQVSAKTRTGIDTLCEAISRRLVPHLPEPGEAVPCLPNQVAWVRAACV